MSVSSLIALSLGGGPAALGNLPGLAFEAAILSAYAASPRGLCVILVDNFELTRTEQTLRALDPALPLRTFADYETLPYDSITPHQDIISSRLQFLATIAEEPRPLIITTLPAVMQRLPPRSFIGRHSLVLSTGDRRDLTALRRRLSSQGYALVSKVYEHGEFAVRGELIDIYPMGSPDPLRIDFLEDTVESIHVFDVQTQRSVRQLEAVSLLPAHEFPFDEDGIAAFRSNYRACFAGVALGDHLVYTSISRHTLPAGIEYYLPLFFGETATFFDYPDPAVQIIITDACRARAAAFEQETAQRAAQLAANPYHPALPPPQVFLSAAELEAAIAGRSHALLSRSPLSLPDPGHPGAANARVQALGSLAAPAGAQEERFAALSETLERIIGGGGRVLLSAISEGRCQTLRDLLPAALTTRYGLVQAPSFAAFLEAEAPLMLTAAPFAEGCLFEEAAAAVITESELYGQPVVRARHRGRRGAVSPDDLIQNLAQLQPGQTVVHIDHGIGRYRGLRILDMDGTRGEYLQIEYAGSGVLYIPITALGRIARYSGTDDPELATLGSDAWSKKKNRAVAKARDVAAELLDLYARRSSGGGRAFSIDERALEEFAAGFSYEETPDQKSAIAATLDDMRSPRPMDRLICGDVGFGKTEVAMRAAFVAACNGVQTALLVPTTILAEQHYQTFRERFAMTAVRVEVLSRFRTRSEQQHLAAELAAGRIDIMIGTHRLLSPSITFHELGLVIIDEEHRFGVRQKEKLRQLRANVDLLTLTATPIPRTLNMSLEGMRSLSIIATPPQNRVAIRTFVTEHSDPVCREAILRELRRGGQVYYLHNDVSTIGRRLEQLQKLVPEARIEIGHGQMAERDLQRVMRDFTHQRFTVLLCSTIIENGLDVPTANTIIIDRADLLGLAQLHQIRGRVGRSHHQAYAYFFTPPRNLLTRDARLRLEALAQHEELGVGFTLATHDLEIRGAGELLGEDQSGQIEQVGFALYMQMLNAAIRALRSGREPSLSELTQRDCEIDLHLPALLPDGYIADVSTRLALYKRLASCTTEEELGELRAELVDRFGTLPPPAVNLLAVTGLRQLATQLGISRISGNGEGGVIEFAPEHRIDPDYIVSLITTCRHGEYLPGPRDGQLRYRLRESPEHSRIALMQTLLRAFAAHQSAAGEAGGGRRAGL